MKHVQLSKARKELPQLVNAVASEEDRVILTRNGKEMAALVSMEDLRKIKVWEDKQDLKQAHKVIKRVKKNKSKNLIDWEEMEKQLG